MTAAHDTDWLAQRFEEQRPRLTAVARRMLGSSTEADDALQEAWIRLSRSDPDAIENLGGWLTTVLSRVCLDVLAARRAHPEVPLEPADAPEAAPGADPEQEAVMADTVGLAMLVVLDTLSPPERVALVLHDMFGVPFDDIAAIVGRSPAAARQLASRARRRVRREDGAGATEDRVRQAQLVDAFLAAARGGEFGALLAVLDPDVILRADATAAAFGTDAETRGAAAVADFSRRYAHGATPALLDGAPALAWVVGGETRVVYVFTTRGERITGIDLIADAERLRELDLELIG